MTTQGRQPGQGAFARFFARLGASNDDLASADLTREARSSGAVPIAECRARRYAVLHGVISTITVHPRESDRWLEATLSDGSGEVLLIWMGRTGILGIEVGRTMTVRGVLAETEGRRVLYNPYYELEA